MLIKSINVKQKSQGKFHPQEDLSISHTGLLSSCSCWVIIIVSGLWLAQTDPLRAMDDPSQEKARTFYKDGTHPQTEDFWRTRGVSSKLGYILSDISKIKDEITTYKTNSTTITPEDLKKYKEIFECTEEGFVALQDLPDIKYTDLLATCDHSKKRAGGWSGAEVIVVDCIDPTLKIAIKKFKDIRMGLEELLYSLVALDINPSPEEIKMARVWDAALSSTNSEQCLNIIMECAKGRDIHDILSLDKLLTDVSNNAIKASGEYFALFHIRNHKKLNHDVNREKYLAYVAKPFNTLIHNPLKEEDDNKPKIASFSLFVKKPLSELEEQLSEFEQIKSDNAVRLLSVDEQERFIHFAKKSCEQFEENVSELYRIIQSWETRKRKSYFLTLTHGDAHGNNFFYDTSPQLLDGEQNPIRPDSYYRITMIDFASIIKTYGDIGDPAEDVGRFLGSLWDWASKQEGSLSKYYEKIRSLQEQFIQSYMKTTEEHFIFTEENKRIFRENSNFYKLRFYRIIANAKKDENPEKDKEIKQKILQSWIQENSELEKENSLQNSPPQKKTTKKEETERLWVPVAGPTKYYIPDPVKGFIESAAEGEVSYLTLLWEGLHRTDMALPPAIAVIAGMGGIGKTSLALEYAREAKQNKAYNLIYWLSSSNESSLLKSYRELLLELGVSIRDANKEKIVALVKQHIPQKGRCLLIYDNVPDAEFLKDKVPDTAHILVTSRCTEGWEHPLILDVFREDDSVRYLFKITGLQEDATKYALRITDVVQTVKNEPSKEVVKKLAKKLDHFPLALAHAAHYIKLIGGKNVSRKHFKDYLEEFEKEDLAHFEEYRNPLTEAQSEINHEYLISKTVRLAGKALSPLANKLLEYCAYLNPDSIAEEIFLEYWPEKKTIEGTQVLEPDTIPVEPWLSRKKLEEVLSQLESLSLIKKSQNQPMFSMHRLLQLVTRNEKEACQQHVDIFSHIVPVFNNLFEKNVYTEKQIEKLLNNFPHILQLLEHSKHVHTSSEELDHLEWLGKLGFSLLSLDLKMDEALYPKHENKAKQQENLLNKAASIWFWNTKVYEDFPHWLIQIVENSHPMFQLCLSQIYMGEGLVKRNYRKGFHWCNKAAEKGNTSAQRLLARLYTFGQGIAKDLIKALKWLTLAANQGDPNAYCELGLRYANGVGVDTNHDEAFQWYTKGAGLGDSNSQFMLGQAYELGLGTKKNAKRGADLYTLAAAQGHPFAQFHLGAQYLIAEQDSKAIKWLTRASYHDNVEATFLLGLIYDGYAMKSRSAHDLMKATGYFYKAVASGHAIASLYFRKYRGDSNAAETLDFYNCRMEAGRVGAPEAQFRLATMFEKGYGTPKDDAEAFTWYTIAGYEGHAKAQFHVGMMYAQGRGVEQNFKKSAKWLLKAAERGDAEAQRELGCVYEFGQGVRQDKTKSFDWYTKAAEQGDRLAQCILGGLYDETGNTEDALKWLTKAAKQGDVIAPFGIAAIYSRDNNDLKAIKWLRRAADRGNELARSVLKEKYGVIYSQTSPVKEQKDNEKKPSPEPVKQPTLPLKKISIKTKLPGGGSMSVSTGPKQQLLPSHDKETTQEQREAANSHNLRYLTDQGIDKAMNAARRYAHDELKGEVRYDFRTGEFKSANEALYLSNIGSTRGNAESQFNLGELYYVGKGGVSKNEKEAAWWYTEAAEQGHMEAQFNLGELYHLGRGVPRNMNKAAQWYTKAAEQGHAEAQFNLGGLYDRGEGVPPDAAQAFQWYTEAADQGHVKAQFNLGVMYKEGNNKADAIKWFTRAADQGDLKAPLCLGMMYAEDNNKVDAIKWFTKAAKQGNADAQAYLREIDEKELLRAQVFPEKVIHYKGNIQDKVKNSYKLKGDDYFSLSAQYANEGRADLAGSFATEASIMYKLAEDIRVTEELQEAEVQWHLKMIHFNEKNSRKEPLQEQHPLKIEKKANQPEAPQQSPVTDSPKHQSFIGKGKGEINSTPVKIQGDNIEHPQEQLRSGGKMKTDKPTMKDTQQSPENSIQNENLLTSQGNSYFDAAIQHLEGGNVPLAEHLFEEANKKYDLAEDIQLAKKIHEEETIVISYEGNLPESNLQVAENPTKALQIDPKSNKLIESVNYTAQGEDYLDKACQHAEAGRLDLAEHFTNEANKMFALALKKEKGR